MGLILPEQSNHAAKQQHGIPEHMITNKQPNSHIDLFGEIAQIFARAHEQQAKVKVKRIDPIDCVTIEIERDDACFDVDVEILSFHEGSAPRHEDGSRYAYDDDPPEVELGEAFTTDEAMRPVILTDEEEERAEQAYLEGIA